MVEKGEMERAVKTENISRFLQSANTPFLQSPLLDDVGIVGNRPAADEILSGQYHNPSLSDLTNLYIQHLKRPDHVSIDESLKTFDIKDHIQGWCRAKSSTAAEPHGLSFSHYESAVKSADMEAFDFLLREIPFRTGFSPSAWQKITDLQIYIKRVWNLMLS